MRLRASGFAKTPFEKIQTSELGLGATEEQSCKAVWWAGKNVQRKSKICSQNMFSKLVYVTFPADLVTTEECKTIGCTID